MCARSVRQLTSLPRPVLKNRVPQEIEDAIVALAIEQPAFGQVRGKHLVRTAEGLCFSRPCRSIS